VADIPIIGTYPRAENYRTTDSYAKYCAKVSDTLTATLSSEDIDH
jgi:NitT/TauT family transport system ATP-binding protein